MELFRALGCLAEPPEEGHRAVAESLGLGDPPPEEEYSELFLFQLYPYASVYLGAEGMMGGEARDRIAGFFRALERPCPPEPDHLAVLLGCYASLAAPVSTEARAAPRLRARAAFLWEHLWSWLPPYLTRFAALAEELGSEFYRRWADLLDTSLKAELEAVGPLDSLPLHLREAPRPANPRREGSDAFLRSVLAPARTGLILCRADIGRGARESGLALRAGERKYALEAMFAQDPVATLGWLEREARDWVVRHGSWAEDGDEVARFWMDRADSTARLFGRLAARAE